jgi:ribosomal protein S18 acetylase RimI-like enzyme
MIEHLLEHIIASELERNPLFIRGPLDAYCAKLAKNAAVNIQFENNSPVGMIAYYCNDLTNESIFVSSIVVLPEFRRSGTGKRLLKLATEHGRRLGFKRCTLEVAATNLAAITFYERQGFHWSSDVSGLMQCPL